MRQPPEPHPISTAQSCDEALHGRPALLQALGGCDPDANRSEDNLREISPGAVHESLTPLRRPDRFRAFSNDLFNDGPGLFWEVPAKMIHEVINLPVLPGDCVAVFIALVGIVGHR